VSPRSPRVREVEFVGAIGEPGGSPPLALPQIAIAGRSNVGKSTLINRLVERKALARTSKRPGRTQEINFFRVDGRFLIADLPGYGFARAPREVRERWGPLVETYLTTTPDLLGVVLLIDARRGVTPDDRDMVGYLAETGIPVLFALTKTDKLNRSGRRAALESLRQALDVDADQTLATSAKTGAGLDTLWQSLRALVDRD